jgi:hypothetical protein
MVPNARLRFAKSRGRSCVPFPRKVAKQEDAHQNLGRPSEHSPSSGLQQNGDRYSAPLLHVLIDGSFDYIGKAHKEAAVRGAAP